MGVIYVSGASEGVGTTAVAAGLAAAWRRAGRTVATRRMGAGDNEPDAALLASIASAKEGDADVVVVDGGVARADSHVDVERLGARTVAVESFARGGAPEEAPWRERFGDTLTGIVVNRRTRYAVHDAAAANSSDGANVLGLLPEDRLLLAPTVAQVAKLSGATLYAGADAGDELIEHLLIGGLITEWGGNYFGRLERQAVIVRGGRTDIQMSALNFPLAALVLTSCETPPQYVHQRAMQQDVPFLTVRASTEETVEALEHLAGLVSIHHPDKVERVAALLEEHASWEALNAAAGLS